MKDLFPGYYEMTENEERCFWESCLFVFDANVLLELYRMSTKNRKHALGLLEGLAERLWIPHQVAQEYQRRRLPVIEEQIERIELLVSVVKDAKKRIGEALREPQPFDNVEGDKAEASKACQRVIASLGQKRGNYQRLIKNDSIRGALDEILDAKVGPAYTAQQLAKLFKEGERRYAISFPPGFADAGKKGRDAYGDWIIWRQTLDKARDEQADVLFVTNDTKNDWWITDSHKRLWPRYELVEEMRSTAGTALQLLTGKDFLMKASHLLPNRPAKSAKKLTEANAWSSYWPIARPPAQMHFEALSKLARAPGYLEAARALSDYVYRGPGMNSAAAALRLASQWQHQYLMASSAMRTIMPHLLPFQPPVDEEDGNDESGDPPTTDE